MDSYASLLGLSEASVDVLNVDTLIVQKDLTVFGKSTLMNPIFPTGAALHKVLTCNDLFGTAVWQVPADTALTGDCTGFGSSNRVDTLAAGTIAVNTLATLSGTQTLSNKTLGSTAVRGTTFGLNLFPSVDDAEINIGFNNKSVGAGNYTWAMGQGSYGCGVGNFGIGISSGKGLLMKLEATTGNISLAYQLTLPALNFPTGAGLGRVLTSDALGNAGWTTPSSSSIMGGDCAGTTDNCIVTKASGVFTIGSTMISNHVFGMTLQAPNGTFGRTQMILNNSTTTNGLLLDNTTGTMQGVDFDMKMGLYSMKNRYELRSGFVKNGANAADGENQVSILGNDVAYFGKVSSGINGYLNAQSGVWTPYIVMPSSDVRKRIVLFEGGTEFNQSDHRFTGFGKIPSALLISSLSAADDVVFSSATSSTSSTETLRVKGTGGIVLPSVGAILPKQVFDHYEEYLHTTAFLGPVTTDSYNTRIVRTGKVVILYVANNIALATVTGGVIGWQMGSLIPTRFRPGSNVNCLLSGKQNGAASIINCLVVSTGDVSLSVALGGTWSGNIGFNTFSITWTL